MFNLNTFVLILNASNSKLWYISSCNVNILGCDTARVQQYSKLSTHPAMSLIIIGYSNTRKSHCDSQHMHLSCIPIHLPGQCDYWYFHVQTVYLVCVHPLARAIPLLVLTCPDCISCLCSSTCQGNTTTGTYMS